MGKPTGNPTGILTGAVPPHHLHLFSFRPTCSLSNHHTSHATSCKISHPDPVIPQTGRLQIYGFLELRFCKPETDFCSGNMNENNSHCDFQLPSPLPQLNRERERESKKVTNPQKNNTQLRWNILPKEKVCVGTLNGITNSSPLL